VWNALVAADYEYQGFRFDANRTPLAGYSIVNARAGVRSDHWQVTLYVKNLTEKTTPQGYFNGGFGAPYGFAWKTPRTWGITLAQSF
jgi:outer membrane receptor protein involved in Fe transport